MKPLMKFASAMIGDPDVTPEEWWNQIRTELHTEENIEAILSLSEQKNDMDWMNFFSEKLLDMAARCPYCGESSVDLLEWDNFDFLTCQTCGTIYEPGDVVGGL